MATIKSSQRTRLLHTRYIYKNCPLCNNIIALNMPMSIFHCVRVKARKCRCGKETIKRINLNWGRLLDRRLIFKALDFLALLAFVRKKVKRQIDFVYVSGGGANFYVFHK